MPDNNVPETPPVTPPVTAGAGQLYVVPAGTPEGITEKSDPLQIAAVCAVTFGFGFTVTVTVKVAPGQVPEDGVTV